MTALCVKQPWATMICGGAKTIEARSWQTPYRGDLLICASASPKNVFWHDRKTRQTVVLPAGCVLGVVELLDVRPMKNSDDKASLWCYAPDRGARQKALQARQDHRAPVPV